MKNFALCACVAALFAAPCFARSDTDTTQVTCKDGSTHAVENMRGACSSHGGVDKKATSEAHAAAKNAEKDRASLDADRTTARKPGKAEDAGHTQAMGAGTGKVWVNDSTKVYHCPGDRYYGKTKRGEYMSEAAAKEKGFRADHGHACNS
jgi:hypothetical protein